MSGNEWCSQRTAPSANTVESLSALFAKLTTGNAPAPDQPKTTSMSTEFQPNTYKRKEDLINKPDHYRWHPLAECYEIAGEFNYNLGTAIAYIWRCGHKHETPVTDLQKAIKHLEFECDRLKRGAQAVKGTALDPSREQVEVGNADIY